MLDFLSDRTLTWRSNAIRRAIIVTEGVRSGYHSRGDNNAISWQTVGLIEQLSCEDSRLGPMDGTVRISTNRISLCNSARL